MKRSIVRIGLGLVMGGLLWGGLPANPAESAIVTFNFTGTVNHNISLTPLTGSVTYNTSILDSNASDNQYNGVITALTVNAGTLSGVLDPLGSGNFIRVVDHNPGLDSFTLRAPLVGLAGDNNFFRLTLRDPSGTAFNNDDLPTTAPSLSDFVKARYRLVFEDANGSVRIRGTINNITAVPLPPAVILFGAGLIALVGLGAGSWRKRINASPSLA